MGRRGGPVAFVLSGGGSLGAVQVGMLRALYERGIVPDLLVATSAGAINAAFIASRPPNVATADELAEIWSAIRRSDVFPAHPLAGFLGFLGHRNSLVPNSGLRSLLERHVKIRRLEEAAVPLHVIAAEILSGRERRLSSGDAIAAVLASAAIPAVLPPVRWGDEELIDGGISNNTPISHALELGAEEILHPIDRPRLPAERSPARCTWHGAPRAHLADPATAPQRYRILQGARAARGPAAALSARRQPCGLLARYPLDRASPD